MQTFLPYPDFIKSASVLDYRRLGKQRVEARQILRIILGNTKGAWSNHPAVNMWRGHELTLAYYGDCMIQEWIRRGYCNNMEIIGAVAKEYPNWFGDFHFHRSHRSNLVRKHPEHYRKYWPYEKDNLDYIWPV